MAARFLEAGEALSFCICEQAFRLAAATSVSYINPHGDKKQLGQKREREYSRSKWSCFLNSRASEKEPEVL